MKKITISDMITIATNSAEAELIRRTGKGFITDKTDQEIIYDILDNQESE